MIANQYTIIRGRKINIGMAVQRFSHNKGIWDGRMAVPEVPTQQ